MSDDKSTGFPPDPPPDRPGDDSPFELPPRDSVEEDRDPANLETRDDDEKSSTNAEPDPHESPFELPPIEGLPFGRDSEEARAIRRIIEQADRERASAASSSS